MPISLEQIRSYSGNGALLVSTDAGGADRLSEAGAGHRLKSFFGVAAAADENRRAFGAIRDAIRNDPRFFAPDVLRRADELLRAAAGDGKVVSADRIRSVVAQLDAMTDPASRRAAFGGMVAGRLAATGVPDFARRNADSYRELATIFLSARAPRIADSGGGTIPDYGSVDVAKGLADFEDLMQHLADRIPDREPALRSLLRRAPDLFVDGSTNRLLPEDELENLVDRFRDAYDAVETAAKAHGLMRGPLLAAIESAGAQPPSPAEIGALASAGAAAASSLRGLGEDTDAAALHEALSAFARAAGGARTPAARSLFAASAVAALSFDERAGVFSALRRPGARNLLAFYEGRAFGDPPDAVARAIVDMAFAVDHGLRAAIASPLPIVAGEPLSAAPSADPADAVPVSVIADLGAPPDFSGPAAGIIRDRFLQIDAADGGTLLQGMRESATNQTAVSIATLMALDPDPDQPSEDGPRKAFLKDLHRGPSVGEQYLLPDGPLASHDDRAACDRIVRLLSGDAGATFAGSDLGLKRKALVVMACCNQSLSAIALSALGEAFSPGHARASTFGFMPLTINGKTSAPREASYRISMDSDGSVRVRYHWKQPVMAVLTPDQSWVGPGSFWEMSAEIRIPQADLDRYAAFDWGAFDSKPVLAAEGEGGFAARRNAAALLSPENAPGCPFTGSVSLGFRFHLDSGSRPGFL